MDRLKNLLARRFRYPALFAGALAFLVAGMLIAPWASPAGRVYATPGRRQWKAARLRPLPISRRPSDLRSSM